MRKPTLPPVLMRKDFDAAEECEYYLAFEIGKYEPVPENIKEIRKKWKKCVRETIRGKRKRSTIAIPARKLLRVRSLALRRGIPYQTLN